MISAIEFFSGIGAFSQAVRDSSIKVIAAFDQSEAANQTFALNYGFRPQSTNLDSISLDQIASADLWWMSPPCTPFTVRGNQKDSEDARAKSFLNLIAKIPARLPPVVLLENVGAFEHSQVHTYLRKVLTGCRYHINELLMCSTQFGVPMRRRRFFLVASLLPLRLVEPDPVPIQSLSAFLQEARFELILDDQTVTKYGAGFDIVDVDDPQGRLICFTKGYARCMKASGSILRMPDLRLRRVSPLEILALLGFKNDFVFPDELDLAGQWRLVGNSVDVRVIDHLLKQVLPALQAHSSLCLESR